MARPVKCPNPRCSRTFPHNRAVEVHIGNSKCRLWRRKYLRSKARIAVSAFAPEPHQNHPRWDMLSEARTEAPPFVTQMSEDEDSSDVYLHHDATNDSMDELSEAETETIPPKTIRVLEHSRAGHGYGTGKTVVDKIDDARSPKLNKRYKNQYYPFDSREDFEVGAWFIRSSVSMANIDNFLRLTAMKNKFSFRSAKELHQKIALLPKPPPWKSCTVEVKGGITRKPIKFFFRDGLEVFRFLYGNPVFANNQSNVPVQVWEGNDRLFDGPMTGDLCWKIQDKVGEGETLGLVILGSDCTDLNDCYGDKKAHCVYMTCGNISNELRMKESARCWLKVAEIPIVKFLGTPHEGILFQRLYHICMDIVTATLKGCSRSPMEMTDARGVIRNVRTVLLAHISDYPEQQLIACVSGSSSPVSLAKSDDFGSPKKYVPRTRQMTLRAIGRLLQKMGMNSTNLARYKSLALEKDLNGVDRPYWRDWKFADPSIFLAPDALHQWHRFFYDHIVLWAKTILGEPELDGRYARLQKRVGYRHFHSGFTQFSQHTGREFRELQRSFIGVIAGHDDLSDSSMLAFRGLLEFIYYAQFDTQSSTSLRRLEESLSLFHANKSALVDAGNRQGPKMNHEFHIPKLELMQHVADRARLLGSLPQYSTEQVERCHRAMAKDPYRSSNKKNYEEQVCRRLDRIEKAILFALYLEHKETMGRLYELEEMPADVPGQLAHVLEAEFLPHPTRNAFLYDEYHIPRNSTTAFILTDRITYGNMKISEVSHMYALPGLRSALLDKFRSHLVNDERKGFRSLPFDLIDCWDHVRIQLKRLKHGIDNAVLPPITVKASPPSDEYPLGLCNFILIRAQEKDATPRLQNHLVAQLRLVFQTVDSDNGRKGGYLAYVELFEPASEAGVVHGVHVRDKIVGLPRVVRQLERDGSRRGRVIKLTDIWRPIDLIPVFGETYDEGWSHSTVAEVADEYFVNYYCDKNVFKSMY